VYLKKGPEHVAMTDNGQEWCFLPLDAMVSSSASVWYVSHIYPPYCLSTDVYSCVCMFSVICNFLLVALKDQCICVKFCFTARKCRKQNLVSLS